MGLDYLLRKNSTSLVTSNGTVIKITYASINSMGHVMRDVIKDISDLKRLLPVNLL